MRYGKRAATLSLLADTFKEGMFKKVLALPCNTRIFVAR